MELDLMGYNNLVNNPNIIQNGDMFFDQRNEGGAVTVTSGGGFIIGSDRHGMIFAASTSGAGNPTIQQQATSSGLNGFPKSLLVTANATPSTTVPAGLVLNFRHTIEGSDIGDLAYGTTGAQTTTLSFWVKTSVANQIIGGSLANSGASRVFLFVCPALAANVWTQCIVPVPGDTTGTWLTGIGTVGITLRIGLAAGSTFTGTVTGAWQAASAGQPTQPSTITQFTATAGATFELTGVRLERGSVATPFWSTPTAQDLITLQRYYRKSFLAGTKPAQNVGTGTGELLVQNPIAVGKPSIYIPFYPPMYAVSTLTTYSPGDTSANFWDETAGSAITVGATVKSLTGAYIPTGATVTTISDLLGIHYTADSGV